MVDSVPRSLIYFSTDVESVLMSETEKSCWALAKQGGREFAAAPARHLEEEIVSTWERQPA